MHTTGLPGMLVVGLQERTEENAMAGSSADLPKLPKSLEGHTIPKERLEEIIIPFVENLAETALKVGDTLPLEADPSDFVRVLESEGK